MIKVGELVDYTLTYVKILLLLSKLGSASRIKMGGRLSCYSARVGGALGAVENSKLVPHYVSTSTAS